MLFVKLSSNLQPVPLAASTIPSAVTIVPPAAATFPPPAAAVSPAAAGTVSSSATAMPPAAAAVLLGSSHPTTKYAELSLRSDSPENCPL